jgi:8-oxo-dGTP diphosphatase
MREVRVVAAVIVRADRVVAARRGPTMRHAGLWEFPGGKVEPFESDPDALRREIREELGVEVVVAGEIGVVVHAYDDRVVRLVALRCSTDQEPRALEHAEVLWLSAAELDGRSWAPADVPLLGAVRRCLARPERVR